MKQLILSGGQKTQVSDEDFDYLNRFNWGLYPNGYVYMNDSSCLLHSVVAQRMGLMQTTNTVLDHRDLDKLNNQRSNLRLASGTQSNGNMPLRKDSTSGYKGVTYSKRKKKWRARLQYQGREVFLGYHITAEEAAKAYDEAARRYFKEFAKCNFDTTERIQDVAISKARDPRDPEAYRVTRTS